MRVFFISFLLLFLSIGNAQRKVTLYYEANSSDLSPTEFKKLNDLIRVKDVKIQKVIGYCDLRSFEIYNDTLANKRANLIAGFIKLAMPYQNFEVSYKGENFNKEKVLNLTRKVEIHFIIQSTPIKKNELANQIKKAKIGDLLVLKNYNFYDRSDVIYPESEEIREELLQVLKDNPKLKIEIQGHICCTPGKDEEEIALKRCLSTYNYLVSNGIEKSRLKYKSFDATKPLYKIPEKNEDEKKANRRIEILILDK